MGIDDAIATLSKKSQVCIQRLRDHEPECGEPEHAHLGNDNQHTGTRPGAVLVLLYEREGVLRVLLTTRSKELRSHPGQTALPGGRVDEGDGGAVDTALREANEEVALPLRSPHVHVLCTLERFVSQYGVLVTPVVALLDDVSVLEELRAAPGEVARIFDHPLEALLDPELARGEPLVSLGSEDWPYGMELHNYSDVPWLGGMYRMHRFRSTASPVKGLTADILLAAAGIVYAREPVFQRWGAGQLKTFTEVYQAIEASPKPIQPMPKSVHFISA
ncbi:NUDIX hydrolase domain-like protein [Russula dissimulans]|nr:NUDIX hydrolase domain-like protein [Russula dissimulans]